jgi:hypothetical protein
MAGMLDNDRYGRYEKVRNPLSPGNFPGTGEYFGGP